MGRPKKQNPEPFWRTERGSWFVQIGKKQVRLSPDKDEAWGLWHELMIRPADRPAAAMVAAPPTLVVDLLDQFLEWTRRNKADRTFEWYRENIQRFAERIPPTLAIDELKASHVTRALEDFPHWSNNTKNDFISALKRAFNWAMEEEMIDRSPLARVKKPPREAREMAVSPAEYASVVQSVKEPGFLDLIELSWETGARVQELQKIEALHFDAENARIVFPPKQAKGKKYHRVIYLTGRAMEIVCRLAAVNPEGPILLNSQGSPWNKNAINCAFCRLQLALGRREIAERKAYPQRPSKFKKAGTEPGALEAARSAHRASVKAWQKEEVRLARELGKKYHLGAFRKGFATEALKSGVDTVSLAHLLGHRDPSMVSKVYGQVQNDPKHMARMAERAKGNG